MLSNFKLANFKSIKEEANFDFKKLNIFIGPNNSGKTSVLLALAFFLQKFQRKSAADLSLSGKYADLSKLEDFAFKKERKCIFDFSISLAFDEQEKQRLSKIIEESSFSHFDFSALTLRLRIPVDESAKHNSLYRISSKVFDGRGKAILGYDELLKENIFISDELKGVVQNVHLPGLIPLISSGSGKEAEKWNEVLNLVNEEPSNFFWLKTPRSIGAPQKKISSTLPQTVGFHGSQTLDVLAYIRDMDEYMKTMNKIVEWVSRFGFKDEVIPKLERQNEYSLNLHDGDLDLRARITDMGFGINQLLPVITQCFYTPVRDGVRREKAIIFIEQPEVHLHPAMQAEVADLFIDSTKLGKQLIVETHSEHLPLRLQRRIAEGEISCEDVAIFYFEKGKEGTRVKELKLDEMGRFKEKEPFPGFFQVEFTDALKQTEAISAKLKGEASAGK